MMLGNRAVLCLSFSTTCLCDSDGRPMRGGGEKNPASRARLLWGRARSW